MSTRIRLTVARELREARVASGLSQREVGQAVAMSHSQVGRIERGQLFNGTVDQLAQLAVAVGLELSIRLFPGPDAIRDVAHVRLLERFRRVLHPSLTWRTEVPLPNAGDLRAWDAVVSGGSWQVAVEAETRIGDVQAFQRRLARKMRDGGMRSVILLAADTVRNREALAGTRTGAATTLPGSARAILAALREGRDPAQSGIVLL